MEKQSDKEKPYESHVGSWKTNNKKLYERYLGWDFFTISSPDKKMPCKHGLGLMKKMRQNIIISYHGISKAHGLGLMERNETRKPYENWVG